MTPALRLAIAGFLLTMLQLQHLVDELLIGLLVSLLQLIESTHLEPLDRLRISRHDATPTVQQHPALFATASLTGESGCALVRVGVQDQVEFFGGKAGRCIDFQRPEFVDERIALE
jgi:hypothetical protein